jgi:hypothetical protein
VKTRLFKYHNFINTLTLPAIIFTSVYNSDRNKMPFTFSHPAAILPLTYLSKQWLSLTGLVIGSLTPDFEYFIRMRVYSSFSHYWTGLFLFDIPFGIILASVFHLVVRDQLIDSLPDLLQKRFIGFKEFEWTNYLKKNLPIVVISCMIGATTHLLWDGFTHQNGHFVQTVSSLQKSLLVSNHSIPIYKLLQHGSSLVGGLLITYAIWKMPKRATVGKGINWNYWLLIVFISLLVLTLRALIGDHVVMGNMIVSAITGGLLGLILTPAVLSRRYNGR